MKKLFISQPMGDYISRDMAIACLTKVEVTHRLATMTDAKREKGGCR